MTIKQAWNRRPVLVLLGGLAAVIDLGLVAANATGVTQLDGAAVAAIGAFVTAVCSLAGAVLQATVTSPATIDAHVDRMVNAVPGLTERSVRASLNGPGND